MNDTVYWIWLSLSCTVATGTFSKLSKSFDGAKEIYDATEREIAECIGYKTSDRSLLANKDLTKAEEIYEFCVKRNVGLLKYSDNEYPKALKNISTPPPLLYYRGKLPDFNSGLYVAMVGTRELSEYGRKNAFNIGYDLATAGATVVSGMALGIDGVALAGALAAEKPTVAILGSGIDVCYPAQHLTLAREIVINGCILTEYPPKTKPSKYNFPKRNRLISGLCSATLVIEGRERSGALITARYAEEQGRALFALPGNVGSEQSELTNLLLKKSAKPATRAEDILDAFENEYKGSINQFLLKDRRNIDMMYVLRTLEVVANCPSDDIYNQPWIIKRPITPRNEHTDVEENYRQVTKAQGKDFKQQRETEAPIQSDPSNHETARRESKVGPAFAASGPNSLLDVVLSTSEGHSYNRQRELTLRSSMPASTTRGELGTVRGSGFGLNAGRAGTNDMSSFDFDELTLKIYKKIPPGGAIEIEDLTTENISTRTVMKHLTQLEAGKFIVILPGGKVMRKY